MHEVVYALTPHSDIAIFELEDGLARGAALELLTAPSSIRRVSVDIATAGAVEFDSPHVAPPFDALLRITAESMSDARPANIDELVAEVANVVGIWEVGTSVVAERDDSWIGVATPGVKLVALLSSGPGIDRGSFDGWLRDALMTSADELPGIGVSLTTPQDVLVAGPTFDSLLEFSFWTTEALEDALSMNTLQPILGSDLLDTENTQVFTTVEHVRTPNENAWQMHESNNGAQATGDVDAP